MQVPDRLPQCSLHNIINGHDCQVIGEWCGLVSSRAPARRASKPSRFSLVAAAGTEAWECPALILAARPIITSLPSGAGRKSKLRLDAGAGHAP